ncbi:MAG: M48 family metallopeptidase [Microscillaceae bacterium]|nr:M48 family metallopeptidase [Microscillaceae bacterium]
MNKKLLLLISLFLGLCSTHRLQAQCDSSYVSELLKTGQWLGSLIFGGVEVTEEKEEEIGDQMFAYVQSNFTLLESDSRLTKLQKILNTMTPHVSRKGIQYDIHLIQNSDLINAFSIAGGHIFITTGIMNWVESDDELAFIIGHEIGHVDLGHTIQHIKKSMTIQSWADYLQLNEYAGVIEQAQTILGTPFGQPDEYSSDQYGATIALKAGYNPHKGKDFFKKLSENEKKEDIPYDLDVWMRTHPYSDQRIICLDYFIRNELKK